MEGSCGEGEGAGSGADHGLKEHPKEKAAFAAFFVARRSEVLRWRHGWRCNLSWLYRCGSGFIRCLDLVELRR